MASDNTSGPLKVALCGNPNSGKSSLFNRLTGLNQKVGNYPGVTIDKRSGSYRVEKDGISRKVEVLDLPGTYSLNPEAIDEQVAATILNDKGHKDHPDVVIYVADSSNLKRSLFLCTELIDNDIPVVLALNMLDVAKRQGKGFDELSLAKTLGIPVIKVNARKGEGIEELKTVVFSAKPPVFYFARDLKKSVGEEATLKRYQKIDGLLESVIRQSAAPTTTFTQRIDRWLLHRVWGFAIFLMLMFLIFQGVFSLAETPMDLIDAGFAWLGSFLADVLPEGAINQLITEGILPGLGGIMVFIPQIAILFFFLAILEDTGYMARVSFLMDRLLRKFGLNGKSVIPLISGMACAIPAVMAARSIGNTKERLITIFVTPLMSCSARLPVYALLIALVIPDRTVGGIFNLQGLTMMGLYLIGFVAALGSAWVLRFLVKAKEKSHFIMEVPVYRTPRWGDVGLTIVEKLRIFIIDAGKVIIAISIILWVMASYAPGDAFEQVEVTYNSPDTLAKYDSTTIAQLKAAERLEVSYAGEFGHFIEPAIRPVGFDWKIGIGLITSFAAREVFVGTMATIYSVGDEEAVGSIREKMAAEINPDTGGKVYNLASGLSLLLFYAFAMQCMSTLAVVYRETRSWKWPVLQLVYMTGLAYLASFIAFQVFS